MGVHIIKKLEKIELPSTVKLIDGATGGFRLIPLFQQYKNDKFIIIDAINVSEEKSPDLKDPAKNQKGDIYLIPLERLYEILDSNCENPGFISFHQTAVSDVMLLLKKTMDIKISGYLLGINIFEPGIEKNLKTHYSLQLTPGVKKKISKAVKIILENI